MNHGRWLKDPKYAHFEGYTNLLISLKQWAIENNYSYSYARKLIVRREIRAYKLNNMWWVES